MLPSVSDGDIYTGTVADFSGMDPIIYRESLQTEQYDSMSLNGECSETVCLYFLSPPSPLAPVISSLQLLKVVCTHIISIFISRVLWIATG